jgi:molybdopterin molybdotransferase
MTGGEKLTPPGIGLLAAAGYSEVSVHRNPRVIVIASGDEVVAPGTPLKTGQLYASNMMEIQSWLNVFGIDCKVEIVADRPSEIEGAIRQYLDRTDVFLTSGGAWGSEKDLMLKVVQHMGWQGIFHRVRMGPGKPVGFGLLEDRPFFILPGGPPSNEMAFIQLALPALLKMTGSTKMVLPEISARLESDVTGKDRWTNFIHARLVYDGQQPAVTPIKLPSRLKSMAQKNAIVILPEGIASLEAGMSIRTQVLPH